jgi:hypothetical protein
VNPRARKIKKEAVVIADRFDPRTFANMEVALERACEVLSIGAEQHERRRYIAGKILECAERGETTLGSLTEAGRVAANELHNCAAPDSVAEG